MDGTLRGYGKLLTIGSAGRSEGAGDGHQHDLLVLELLGCIERDGYAAGKNITRLGSVRNVAGQRVHVSQSSPRTVQKHNTRDPPKFHDDKALGEALPWTHEKDLPEAHTLRKVLSSFERRHCESWCREKLNLGFEIRFLCEPGAECESNGGSDHLEAEERRGCQMFLKWSQRNPPYKL